MSEGDHVNVMIGDSLWDREGLEWTTKHSRWATAKQASGFVGRDGAIGLVESPGRPLIWMAGAVSQQWWGHAKRHFEVPGTSDAEPDEENRTWSAHIWQRGEKRLAVFETNC